MYSRTATEGVHDDKGKQVRDDSVEFTVLGEAKPQGSKKAIPKRYGRGVNLVESAGEPLKWWRYYVSLEAHQAMAGRDKFEGAVGVSISFYFTRPASHFGTGKNAGKLKKSSPVHHVVRPDIDKLTRAVLDSLTKRVYRDDSCVVKLEVTKDYTGGDARTEIEVWEIG